MECSTEEQVLTTFSNLCPMQQFGFCCHVMIVSSGLIFCIRWYDILLPFTCSYSPLVVPLAQKLCSNHLVLGWVISLPYQHPNACLVTLLSGLPSKPQNYIYWRHQVLFCCKPYELQTSHCKHHVCLHTGKIKRQIRNYHTCIVMMPTLYHTVTPTETLSCATSSLTSLGNKWVVLLFK